MMSSVYTSSGPHETHRQLKTISEVKIRTTYNIICCRSQCRDIIIDYTAMATVVVLIERPIWINIKCKRTYYIVRVYPSSSTECVLMLNVYTLGVWRVSVWYYSQEIMMRCLYLTMDQHFRITAWIILYN